MRVTQSPKDNAITPSPESKSPRSTPAETQRKYRLRLQKQAEAYREIRDIIARTEAES